MIALPDYKHDPNWHHCAQMRCWLPKRTCAYFWRHREECLGCTTGERFEKELKIKPLQPKFPQQRLHSFVSFPNNTTNQKPKPKAKPDKKRVRVKTGRRVMFDWKRAMAVYNEAYGEDWKTLKKWLTHLYERNSGDAIGGMIGTTCPTVMRKLRELGIKKPYNGVKKTDLFLAIPPTEMAGMSKVDIMRRTGLSESWTSHLIAKHGREYKRKAWGGQHID